MISLVKKSILATFFLAIITCGIYPVSVWIVGQLAFRQKANGSIILRGSAPIGSELIAQAFTRPEYFHPRPSAAGEKGYDGANSSGTNFSLTNKKYQDALEANIKKVIEENPGLQKGQIPPDMVTASASGLDPHISSENANIQINRVAKSRNVDADAVKAFVSQQTYAKGLISESMVNVLILNVQLDEKFPIKK